MHSHLPDPESAPELFEGLLARRVMAFLIDILLISVLLSVVSLVGGIAGFLTFGLAWLALLVLVPAAVVVYYASTLGSHRRATYGMQAMDVVLTPAREGILLNGPLALLHALLFWVTVWISWPVSLLFALFTPRRQMLHDLILGTLMVRHSPMRRHWRMNSAQAAAQT